MTQEEKQLLLKDLSARVPYSTLVCLNPGAYGKPEKCLLTGVDDDKEVYLNVDSDSFRIDHIKPYLRPISSMTKEEVNEYINTFLTMWDAIDWLLEHHFDYRGLIEMGLALEAPDGMYKTE